MAKFLSARASKQDDLEVFIDLTPKLLRTLIPGDFCLLPIPHPGGGSIPGACQCILMLHEKGIFVFLYQQQYGLIHGDAWKSTWTSTNMMGEQTYFSSPYLRNKTNLEVLANILKLPPDQFHSVLVFNSECDVRRVPREEKLHILHIEQLEAYFARLLPTLPALYSHTQLEALRDIFLVVITQGRVAKKP